MSPASDRPGHSIAAVSKLTGVSCHALRVWERRYGFPVPERSASGHRRYPKDQVGALRHLALLARSGQSIGDLIGEYRAGKLNPMVEEEAKVAEKSASTPVVDRLFEGDMSSAEELIDRMAGRVSAFELVERVIEPALIDVGERWFRGEGQIFQERCATAVLLARLWQLLDRARRANPDPPRTVLVGTVHGDHHEGGALMISLALELAGWRAVPLGVDLPVPEYRKAIEAWRPDALALSFVLSRNINKRFRELSEIRGVPVFVGGRSIVNHQGLARRHALIPLVGPLQESASQLMREVELRAGRRAPPTEPGG
jgi:MerR family transcriptional regulator, light-induced transcriptional regulator